MAAIAKFISFDGGIAFSESVVKFQKRSGDAKLFPLSEIDSIGVRRPQQENRGFIRLQTKEGKLYRIFFDDDQYSQAAAFKKQLDEQLAAAVSAEEPASEPVPAEPEPERPAPRTGRWEEQPDEEEEEDEEDEDSDEYGGGDPLLRKWWFWTIVVLLVIAIAGVVAIICLKLKAGDTPTTPTNPSAITIPASIDEPADAGADAGTEGVETP